MATLRILNVNGRLSDADMTRACSTFGPVGRTVSVYNPGDDHTRTVYIDMPDPLAATKAARALADMGIGGRTFTIDCSGPIDRTFIPTGAGGSFSPAVG